MKSWIESVYDLDAGRETIRRRPYGVIEVQDGRFLRIVFRPWPKLFTADDVLFRGQFSPRRRDACRLFFNQPQNHSRYLALKFIVSDLGTSFASIRRAMLVLDRVAEIKRSDAIVAHVTTDHVSDRLLFRWGWERHLESSGRRHFIKRFYGKFSTAAATAHERRGQERPDVHS